MAELLSVPCWQMGKHQRFMSFGLEMAPLFWLLLHWTEFSHQTPPHFGEARRCRWSTSQEEEKTEVLWRAGSHYLTLSLSPVPCHSVSHSLCSIYTGQLFLFFEPLYLLFLLIGILFPTLNLCIIVVQSLSRVLLCNPMDCSMPGFPVLHYFPKFVQTLVHSVSDAIQPSHPLLPPSPHALNFSQH